MTGGGFPPRLIGIAKRYNVYLVLGFIIVVSALALGALEAQAIAAIHDAEVAGTTGSAEHVQAVRTEAFIRVINPAWNFAGLGLLTFGIGMSIVMIVHNLTGAAASALGEYDRAFPGRKWPRPPVPRFARAFPILMIAGLVLVILNFLFAVSGGLAAVQAAELEATAEQAPAATSSYAAFVEVLRTPQRPGTLAFIVLGIGLSLPTIVYNLRAQNRALPHVLRGLATGKAGDAKGPARPPLPRLPFALLAAGFAIVLSASYPLGFLGATARGDIVAGGATLDAATRLALADRLALTTSLFPPIAVLGIVTLLAGIVYWLLLIIQALRDQRAILTRLGREVGTKSPPIEQAVWPETTAGYLAGAGVLTLAALLVPAFLLAWSRMRVVRLAGVGGDALIDATFLANVLGTLVPDLRFTGMALVMLAIGLALGAIMINLTGMGAVLGGTMAGVMRSAREGVTPERHPVDEGDVEGRSREAMARFPVKLFAPILVGALILISTTFPFVVPIHVNIQTQLVAALGAGDSATANDLATQAATLAALREPWNFIGMGLVFFGIGRFFGTIIGFVQGRRVLISETCASLSATVKERGKGETGSPATL